MKRYVKSSSYTGHEWGTLEEELRSSQVTEVNLRDISGKILGTFSKEDAIDEYGSCKVSGWYTESRSCASVWIISHKR